MRRTRLIAIAALCSLAAAGCVERQMTLVTDPPGAGAYYNGSYVGETPVTFHFTYYQAPDLKFEKDGYATLRAAPSVKTPFYQRFPLDFFAEIAPFTLRDRQSMSFALEKASMPESPDLIIRAEELRKEMRGD